MVAAKKKNSVCHNQTKYKKFVRPKILLPYKF
jgi:hypothetical protein